MSHTHEYYLDGFRLKVNDFAYLVEVEINFGTNDSKVQLKDLPDWVFDSRHAIWLTVDDLPIEERATRGDQIRKKLIESCNFCRRRHRDDLPRTENTGSRFAL